MNKYQYKAIRAYIFGCTLIIISGQVYSDDEIIFSLMLSVLAAIEFIGALRYEKKAKNE